MIKSEAFFRTFFIKAASFGTAFVLQIDNAQYLISAKHLFESLGDTVSIQYFRSNRWNPLTLTILGVGDRDVDVVVFQCPDELTSSEFALAANRGGFLIGQDVFMLGFPYRLWGNAGEFLDGLPCPFIKKGVLAFFDQVDNYSLYIDALGNEGYSGGPIFYFEMNDPTRPMWVTGVVSKFRTERESVITDEDEKTGFVVPYNTGIQVGVGIGAVLDIVKSKA